ncbi:MAG: hypothetical protein C0432_04810 [Candidatus Puniceispirillum sp.]|nr:hypothetical protein [Candidatus Pelagibacter sp.]MBA4283594.1 hypothetical protein [Candidatus Puniceispirillum sp.]
MKKILSLLLLTSALSDVSFGISMADEPTANKSNFLGEINSDSQSKLKPKIHQRPLADSAPTNKAIFRHAMLNRAAAMSPEAQDSDGEEDNKAWSSDDELSYQTTSRPSSTSAVDRNFSSVAPGVSIYQSWLRLAEDLGLRSLPNNLKDLKMLLDTHMSNLISSSKSNRAKVESFLQKAASVSEEKAQQEYKDIHGLLVKKIADDQALNGGFESPNVSAVSDPVSKELIDFRKYTGSIIDVDSYANNATLMKDVLSQGVASRLGKGEEFYGPLYQLLLKNDYVNARKLYDDAVRGSTSSGSPYCASLDAAPMNSSSTSIGLPIRNFDAENFDLNKVKEFVNRSIDNRWDSKSILSIIFNVPESFADQVFRSTISNNIQALANVGKISDRLMNTFFREWRNGRLSYDEAVYQLQQALNINKMSSSPAVRFGSGNIEPPFPALSSSASGSVAPGSGNMALVPSSVSSSTRFGSVASGSFSSNAGSIVGAGAASASSSRSQSPDLVPVTEADVKKVLMDMRCNLRTVRDVSLYERLAVEKPEIVTSESARDLLLGHILDNGGLRSPQAGILKYLSS